MDIAAAPATSITKTVNVLATCTTQRITNPTTLAPSCFYTRPNMLTLHASTTNFFTIFPTHQRAQTPSLRNSVLNLTCRSTKPDIDSDNVTDKNSTVESNSNSKTQQEVTPTSNETLYPSSNSAPSSSRGLVLDLGPANSWDGVEIGSPVVKRFLGDEEERWYMWYHGTSNENLGSDSIGLAVSSNGVHWQRGGGAVQSSREVGLVMNCSKDWWAFDTKSIRPSEVLIMSSAKIRASSAVYWLYYTGFSSEKVEVVDALLDFNLENPEGVQFGEINGESGGIGKVSRSLPGLAISQDGRHWARIEGEHHTGALFDVGSEGEWDSMFIAKPHVVFHGNGDLRMYYHSFDMENGHFGIGIARSRDGIKWVKLGKIMGGGLSGCFDELGVMNACVVRNSKDGKYVMAYEGVAADGGRAIGLAVSPNGLKDWRRFQDGPILKLSANGWDDKGVGSPCLVQMGGNADEWRLYYRGSGHGRRTGIGMAVSQGNEMRKFGRWTGFHL